MNIFISFIWEEYDTIIMEKLYAQDMQLNNFSVIDLDRRRMSLNT